MTMFEPGLIVLMIFGLGVITLLVLVYVAYACLDRAESLLEKSRYIQGVKEGFFHAGMPGKVLRVCSIAFLLTMPGPYVQRGLANSDEIKRFPRSLRFLLIGLGLALTIEVLAMLAFQAWLYYV